MVLDSFRGWDSKPIRDQIYEALREAIFRGELKSGEHLIENKLSERMNVSRTPIREALRKLEAEGLVNYLPHKGVVVRGFTSDDIIEIYAIRESLEALSINYSVKNITDEEIGRLQELLTMMEGLMAPENSEKLFAVSQEFNELLVQASRMPRIIKLVATYKEYLKAVRIVTMSNPTRKSKAIQEHREILQAVSERDAHKAEILVRSHLLGAREKYLRALNV